MKHLTRRQWKQHNQLFINRAKSRKRQQLEFFIWERHGPDGRLNAEDFCEFLIYISDLERMEDIIKYLISVEYSSMIYKIALYHMRT